MNKCICVTSKYHIIFKINKYVLLTSKQHYMSLKADWILTQSWIGVYYIVQAIRRYLQSFL